MLPNALWQTKSYWNTGTNTPGEYIIYQTIFYGTEAISMATCTFAIVSDLVGIAGDIEVTPKEVKTYGSLTFDYLAKNTGNTDLLNTPLNILIIDSDTGEPKHTLTDVVTITKGSSWTSTKVWDSVFLKEPKTYLAILQAGTKSLDSCSFKVLSHGFIYGTVIEDTDSPAFSFTVFSEDYQEYLGGGNPKEPIVIGDSVHSNTKAIINSSSHRIVETPYINDSPIIGKKPGVPNPDYKGPIPFPKIDMDYYRQKAKEQGGYYANTKNVQLPSNSKTAFVETQGTVKISGNVTI